MKILHIYTELVEGSNYHQRMLAMDTLISSYCLSCDKAKRVGFENPDFHRTTFFQFPKIEFAKEYFFKKAVREYYHQHFKHFGIDLIHSHFAYLCASAGMELAQHLQVPHVVTVRGSDVLLYPKQSKFLKQAVTKNLQSANKIFCVSRDLMHACERLGVDTDKLVHLPDGHDEVLFCYDSKISKDHTILFVGNLIGVKNPIRMLEAFIEVSKQDLKLSLKIAGEGELRNSLEDRIQKASLEDRVKLLGQLDRRALGYEMQKAKLLFLPSISEGWPNVIQESLACGTPVVASSVGGIPEMIQEGKNGFFCDPYSISDMSGKLLEGLKRSWNIEDLLDLPSRYTRTKIISQLMREYEKLLQ